MTTITLQKAKHEDVSVLTSKMKETFDHEAERWLDNTPGVIDDNIQPPGYSDEEMTLYMINHLHYYKILLENRLVGGIVVTISGSSCGRIDRIFIEPNSQGKGIGSKVIHLVEELYPTVYTWDLETSSRQLSNHYFYEKLGYILVFKSDEEYCYIKKKKRKNKYSIIQSEKDLSNIQYEQNQMHHSEFYQTNLENSSFSNSNLMKSHFSNCNLSSSTFQNINLRNNLLADLNMSCSVINHVNLSGVQFTNCVLGKEINPLRFNKTNLSGTTFEK